MNYGVDTLIFWVVVHKYAENGVNLLQVTHEGKECISSLHSHVPECADFILDSNRGQFLILIEKSV